ncbi:MAG: hypothetical protein WA447_17255 [Candidatus Binatus sp.]
MQHDNKNIGATTTAKRVKPAQGWFDSPCYYVSIAYGGSQMGLLVRTDDEERARREADRLCTSFGAMARTLSIRKVVIQ